MDWGWSLKFSIRSVKVRQKVVVDKERLEVRSIAEVLENFQIGWFDMPVIVFLDLRSLWYTFYEATNLKNEKLTLLC